MRSKLAAVALVVALSVTACTKASSTPAPSPSPSPTGFVMPAAGCPLLTVEDIARAGGAAGLTTEEQSSALGTESRTLDCRYRHGADAYGSLTVHTFPIFADESPRQALDASMSDELHNIGNAPEHIQNLLGLGDAASFYVLQSDAAAAGVVELVQVRGTVVVHVVVAFEDPSATPDLVVSLARTVLGHLQ